MTQTIFIMSGKGGVGKSTISVNLAHALYRKNKKIGVIDADIHGPNVMELLGYNGIKMDIQNKLIIPFEFKPNFKISSIAGFVSPEKAIVWRGPMKHSAIKQLIEETKWDYIDYLIIDLPPGTGDEHLSAINLVKSDKFAVIVSTPQKISIVDTIKTIDFCHSLDLEIKGLIENMSNNIFGSDTIKKLCQDTNNTFLGSLSLEKDVVDSAEKGISILDVKNNNLKNEFNEIVEKILGGI